MSYRGGRYSFESAVAHKRRPECRKMTELHMPDTLIKNPNFVELSADGFNSEVRTYRAIRVNGDFLRDKRGIPVLGERIDG